MCHSKRVAQYLIKQRKPKRVVEIAVDLGMDKSQVYTALSVIRTSNHRKYPEGYEYRCIPILGMANMMRYTIVRVD